MRNFLLSTIALIVVSAAQSARAANPQCVAGGNDQWVEQQLQPGTGRPFISKWIAEANPLESECPECLRAAIRDITGRSAQDNSIKGLLGPGSTSMLSLLSNSTFNQPQEFISYECIQSSVKLIPNTTAPQRLRCASDSGAPDPKKLNSNPCLSSKYVSFMQYTFNSALKCLSNRGSRIDPQLLFEKINNESGFAGFLSSGSGMGASQLMPYSTLEMLGPGFAGNEYLKKRMRHEDGQPKQACEAFKPLIDNSGVGGPCSGNCRCRIASIPNGVARNVLAGIGIFLYYREEANGNVHNRLARLGLNSHPDFERIRDLMTLIAYNKGLAGSSETLTQISRYLKGPNKLSYLQLRYGMSGCPADSDLPAAMRRGVPCRLLSQGYVRAMRDKMKLVFNDERHRCQVAEADE